MEFEKYQALGNDYLIINPSEIIQEPRMEYIRWLCDRHLGIGADGVLIGPSNAGEKQFGLRIFNPDGSEAEKSGNGLRIFGRYLFDHGLVMEHPFQVSTKGGMVQITVKEAGDAIEVFMGKASFNSKEIPVPGPERSVTDEILIVGGIKLRYNAVTIGNPHCVLFVNELDKQEVMHLGPSIERHENFPNRTNVQFVKILARDTIQIEIWERGAGYTLSSGSSACAAGVVAFYTGRCDGKIDVIMPGGILEVKITDDLEVTQTGPAIPVFRGRLI